MPGDGKPWLSCIALLAVTTGSLGSCSIFNPTTGVPRGSLTRPRSTTCLTAYRPKGAQISTRRWLAKVRFVRMRGGFFKIVVDVSMVCKILATHMGEKPYVSQRFCSAIN